jgi:hypothetical protein
MTILIIFAAAICVFAMGFMSGAIWASLPWKDEE